MKSWKLGTRGSLLALAQSRWVAQQLQRVDPELSIALEEIQTSGDRILEVSLRSVPGKDFFVAELDEALLSGRVDFTVHSYKDLSLQRPSGIVCAAIPERENPRDVVLFSPRAWSRLQAGQSLKIGTSSPRRLYCLPQFLKKALPQTDSDLKFIEIRGNVHTRLKRLHEPVVSERYLDGVVLAFAGLIRLWRDELGGQILKELLDQTRWMVLPLEYCPGAAAQGALAIECRRDDEEKKQILEKLNSFQTAAQVHAERALLGRWGGGGCHQKLGMTVIDHVELGHLMFLRGESTQGQFVQKQIWNPKPKLLAELDFVQDWLKGQDQKWIWDGAAWRAELSDVYDCSFEEGEYEAVLVAHARACHGEWEKSLKQESVRVWTAGVQSWFELARKGIWVEGCLEGLGFEHTQALLKEKVLQLPQWKRWKLLTHAEAISDLQEQEMMRVSTYRRVNCLNRREFLSCQQALREAKLVFWTSASQFLQWKQEVSPQAFQFCGPGKTATCLHQAGVRPIVFPSVKVWRQWLKLWCT